MGVNNLSHKFCLFVKQLFLSIVGYSLGVYWRRVDSANVIRLSCERGNLNENAKAHRLASCLAEVDRKKVAHANF